MSEAKKYLLGLDAGNTVIKAVLFDLDGNQVAMHALDGQSVSPQPGHVERDLDELWANAGVVIKQCIKQARIRADEISAVGCAGHGNGLYLVDKKGTPVVGIQSLDTRAAELAGSLNEAAGERFHELCLQKPWPSQTPTLLAWIKHNRPELYERTGTVLLCKDFITYRLTGEFVSEISDMSGCGLVRMPGCNYDDELLALYDLADAKELLPRIANPCDVVGTVTSTAAELTGLAAGTPVIAGFFDVVSSALGAGTGRAGEASIIAGTWSINQVFSSKPVIDPSVFMVSAFDADRFVNIEASATSAANLEWYVRELVERGTHREDAFDYCNEKISGVEPRIDDPLFHPFLYGSAKGAEYRAGFYGLAGWHGESHLLRALFEGVVFEHRRHVGVLKAAGVTFDRAGLSGGGSRSPHWPQMFADCLGVPIAVAEARETGALGAAIGAAIAISHVGSYEEGLQRMTRVQDEFEPNLQLNAHYDARYETYLSLCDAMSTFWSNQQQESQK